jgi:uncharacterized protein (DUF302 family)
MIPIVAQSSNVLVWEIDKPLESVYSTVYDQLENHRFYVVFEPDIQSNLSRMAEKWGDNYNRNKLQGIRSLVFCNGWYANAVSNADPNMLALCPLHITLIQQDNRTRILFLRPSVIAQGSKAEAIGVELEQAVSKALDAAVSAFRK